MTVTHQGEPITMISKIIAINFVFVDARGVVFVSDSR